MSNLLVSLPKSVGQIKSYTESLGGQVTYHQFQPFKIGTLDSLITQIEQLTKLDSQISQALIKIEDYKSQLGMPLDSKDKVNAQLASFKWDINHFRPDRPLVELIDTLQSETLQLDSDLKNQFQSYQSVKGSLLSIQKRQDGDLSIKSLHSIVTRDDFILDSEHLTTLLLAIPLASKQDFLNSYETLTEFVVPRSAKELAQDQEYILYSITIFKKYESTFLSKARELKWVPREFKYSDELINELKNEYSDIKSKESTQKNDLIRLINISFNEILLNNIHLKFIKAFVESVLRYGLPADFICFTVYAPNDSNNKVVDKIKLDLYKKFDYLSSDKDKNVDLNDYVNLVDVNYQPFAIYQFDFIV